MSGAAGTIERLALLLAQALVPLKDQLAAGNLVGLFNELGLAVPPSAQLGQQVVNAAQQGAAAATQLPPLIVSLTVAIQNEDVVEIIQKGVDTLDQAKSVIQAAEAMAGTLPAALNAVGVDGGNAATFAAQFAERLFGYALIRFLETEHPVLLASLAAVGVLERVREPKLGGGTYLARRLRLDMIGMLISQPKAALATIYGWGQPGFEAAELLRRIAELLRAIGLPVGFDENAAPPVLQVRAFSIQPDGTPPGLLVSVEDTIPAGLSLRGELAEGTTLTVSLSAGLVAGLEVEITPPQNLRAAGSTGLQGSARMGVEREAPAGERLTLIGLAGSAGLRSRSVGLAIGADFDWDGGTGAAQGEFTISGDLRGGQAFIDFGEADSFVSSLLPAAEVECDFDLGFDWSVNRGLSLRGSSALEIKLPVHIALGPIEINGLSFGVGIEDNRFPVTIAADIAARLGVLDVVVEEIGLNIILSFPPGGGDVGPLAMESRFKPPVGAGISVDTGAVKGGGYLRADHEAGEYIGALELSFQGVIDLKAFGIINTKLPGGEPGFAFLILITAEFAPIQLGYGFTLLGVGGLLSLNRTLDTNALRTGVRTGALNSILFPKDVVANIGRIVSDIKTVFPLAQGHFIIAPMGKLGWGTPTLISLELGVIIDIPEPQIVIVGVLRMSLPTEDAPLLRLQVNFAGGIDFDEGLIWFDAALFDSRLITFALEGQMALRIGWGSRPMLVITVGGFHPAFREIPDDLRGMTRITLSLLADDNPRLTIQTYFAVTSNTVQSGARVELYAAACGFNVYGFLGYDLLIQFNPFRFVATLCAGLALRRGTSVIAGISLRAELSGPAPWHVHGHASLEILFFDITVSFDETWGIEAHAEPVEIEQVLALVQAALADDRNWQASAPPNATAGISVRALEALADALVIQPFAVLAVSQKVVPLDYKLERFGEKKPDVDLFTLTSSSGGTGEQREEFAVANFRKMSDSQKLSARSFEKMRSGLMFSTGDTAETGARVAIEVDYELSYVYRSIGLVLRVGLHRLIEGLFSILVNGSSASRNAFSPTRSGPGIPPAAVEIVQPDFIVVGVADLAPVAGVAAAGSMAEAVARQDALVAANPALRGKIQVLSRHELEMAA